MQNIEFGVVTQKVLINVEEGTAFTPFSPVDENGEIANNGDAYGIVIDALGIGEVKQLVVMTAGCIDKICAEQHYGESYSAEAISALENIVIYDNHKIGGGGGDRWYVKDLTDWDAEEPIVTFDKSFDEVLNAINDGKDVWLKVDNIDYEMVGNNDSDITFSHFKFFPSAGDVGGEQRYDSYVMHEGGTIENYYGVNTINFDE